MKIASKLYSLGEIAAESPNWHFNIPIYQRLYVWGDDQVLTLLNDLANAYEHGEDLFFLGGTLLVEQNGDEGRQFDLIDGQQRFTTLWLLCHAWQECLTPFLTVTDDKVSKPRLRFAIRPEVNHFLETLVFGESGQPTADEEATRRMRTALDLMKSVFEKRPLPPGVANREDHLTGLTDFVFCKVKFVITTVPRETDLNKLFEVINNRGVQLQHHEILKARMLDALSDIERGPYAVMWDACADMDNFIERNLGERFEGLLSEVAECYVQGQLPNAQSVREMLEKHMQIDSDHHALSLAEILKTSEESAETEDPNQSEIHDPTWVRSIFGFPLFLQHTLRIWLFENDRCDLPRLLDRELLTLFETHFFDRSSETAGNVRSFIDLLWRLRVIFDEHLIKWADQGEAEVQLISKITVSPSSGKSYMNRSRDTDSNRGFSLLQSMLYHSQDNTTQYWVTPMLLFLHQNPSENADGYYAYLRHLDNNLLGSEAGESLVVRTLAFMKNPWQRRSPIHQQELTLPSGVKFAHYWFYKLEFVLWFQYDGSDEKWEKFRLTAKSSVEHISPQTPNERDDNKVDQAMDHFGNLALVSRSLNSEFGHRPYNEKRLMFINSNKKRLDSLKMALIYKNGQWNDEIAFDHQNRMIKCLDSYFNDPSEK